MKNTNLFIIIGASASGKSTLARKTVEYGNCYTVKSMMTRPPRDSDKSDEVDFVSDDQFIIESIKEDRMIEWSHFSGHRYGTHKKEVAALTDWLFAVKVIEPAGALALIEECSNHPYINVHLINVRASRDVLISRLKERGPSYTKRILGIDLEIEKCKALFNSFADDNNVRRLSIDGESNKSPLQELI